MFVADVAAVVIADKAEGVTTMAMLKKIAVVTLGVVSAFWLWANIVEGKIIATNNSTSTP